MRLSAAIAIAIRIQFVYANELAAIIGPVQFGPSSSADTDTQMQIHLRRYTDTDTGMGQRDTQAQLQLQLQPWPRAQPGVK